MYGYGYVAGIGTVMVVSPQVSVRPAQGLHEGRTYPLREGARLTDPRTGQNVPIPKGATSVTLHRD
jgi:hypothetical protein